MKQKNLPVKKQNSSAEEANQSYLDLQIRLCDLCYFFLCLNFCYYYDVNQRHATKKHPLIFITYYKWKILPILGYRFFYQLGLNLITFMLLGILEKIILGRYFVYWQSCWLVFYYDFLHLSPKHLWPFIHNKMGLKDYRSDFALQCILSDNISYCCAASKFKFWETY